VRHPIDGSRKEKRGTRCTADRRVEYRNHSMGEVTRSEKYDSRLCEPEEKLVHLGRRRARKPWRLEQVGDGEQDRTENIKARA
jgi:hypothetical protein